MIGIIVLLITACIQKKFPKLKKEAIKSVVILGFIQTTLEYIFFYIGLSYASGFKGAILNPTSTFMMVILAHFFYKDDKLTFRKTLGCIVGFLGIIIVFKLVQPEKANDLIALILSGITILFNFVQSSNTASLILVTVLGIVTLLKFKQP